MRIATLGFDEELVEFVRQIERSPKHHLVGSFDAGDGASEIEAISPQTRATAESWEGLLSGTVADLVIVASRPSSAAAVEQRDDQLRKLVQAGTPMLLIQSTCQMIVAFELEMIRQDSKCVMLPYHPMLFHPAYQAIRKLVTDENTEQLGNIEQIIWNRQAVTRDRKTVLDTFTHDAIVLRDLLGNVTRIAAMVSSDSDSGFANLGVQLTGSDEQLARWSIGPVQEHSGAKLTVVGSTGSAVLAMLPNEPCQLSIDGKRKEIKETCPVNAALAWAEEHLASDDGSMWDQACRVMELEDAVQRSARRGRTIELYNEMVSERETFKSMMAAGGCGLLLWVMFLLLVAGIVEGLQLPIRDSLFWRLWPVYLAAPLFIFLLMQLLQLAAAKPETPTVPEEDEV
ncbi:MAG: hypothetical protein CMJ77_23270 [Planctomycetaceae bacterium]|nr:hypothetical protein [Planctomycetaceae bacterium]